MGKQKAHYSNSETADIDIIHTVDTRLNVSTVWRLQTVSWTSCLQINEAQPEAQPEAEAVAPGEAIPAAGSIAFETIDL